MRDTTTLAGLYAEALRLLESHTPFIMVTVIDGGGSNPTTAGAKMLVTSNSFMGTVGGGELESKALDVSRELLARSHARPLVEKYSLVRDLGSECGGWVSLLYDPQVPWHLHIYGGGHVAAALAPAALKVGLAITVYDHREDAPIRKVTQDHPEIRLTVVSAQDAANATPLGPKDLHIVMTPSHVTDINTALNIIRRGSPAYLGVMGSRRKALQLKKELEAHALGDRFDEISIPAGVPIGSRTPPEIAISITAELISHIRDTDKSDRED